MCTARVFCCYSLCTLLWALLAGHPARAQIDNLAFYQDVQSPFDSAGDLSLRLYGLGFNRNNEYFHPNEPGRTFFGMQLQPELSFQLNKRTQLFGGLHYRQDFGNPDPYLLQPVWRLVHQRDSLRFVFGSLYGSVQHRLPLPIYAFEYVIQDRVEEGLQLLYDYKGWHSDMWVDWQRMIYDKAAEQEAIWAGWTNTYTKHIASWSLTLAQQFTVYHEGGQIDTSNAPLLIYTNTGLEAGLRKDFTSSFLHAVYGSYHWLHWDNFSFSPGTAEFQNGLAHLFSAGVETQLGGLQVNYYKGWYFQSPLAYDIYTAAPLLEAETEVVFQEQEVFFIRLLNTIELGEHLSLSLRLEPFYDFKRNRWDFNNGLYLCFEDWYRLGNISGRRHKAGQH